MKDELLAKYLPSKEQLGGRLPERDFFFGVLCTLRNQYMKDIIAEAHKARYTIADDNPKQQGIAISEAWIAELEKHPYHSSIFRETRNWNILDEGVSEVVQTSP